ncbi:acetyl/propionyl/methylcrotonyl-CoA carboxylase subunit alpha [Altericroceibacterium spongiae]|uniref:Acetyl/propionyl/methylcrotonyl-CoA carboxylase subunit alpha n=1 Tax=Altericroceibacterium spongiae TaxID=2320269 RepID=A0A420EEY7_9SPHN|nr:acetyl/propionyl/methylcrotonyl-CoA carboxylase subunit alpha [Altericroceibacterium spongiae]RKF19265.1 acetyl/propionyl/methylcrotonyl-CoA carboxylase subunit alpha [Altericroceibacterium spongiae]
MIQSLLIANRGEIACRIIRTARAMGVRTVAVYSDADAQALHVRMADQAIHIGPSQAAESYLKGDVIIAAAKESGAEAIHPGYGFLSENAGFAQSVADAGLIWVGPQPDSIRAMGLKDAAKALMAEAGVPVTPGYYGSNQDPDFLAREADSIGYPVLIKAVAGGGGKGMRKVDDPADFADALTSCRREATASFGNDVVLIEKWIESPRHIEVQIFGDTHGQVVHLFERDCSLQRRHQKVIEEAPAPGMDELTREAICMAAVRAGQAVNYVGAGTVEFIADGSEGLKADRVWFMEMNTRLQVEHPVTEEITGVDLVEWQLRVASGEPLPLAQQELSISGHAMEARLYAEDPASGFLPSTGRLEVCRFPQNAVRVETGVEEGAQISPFYDPMIAKLVTHGPTRKEAIATMQEGLDGLAVWPVRTNAGFLHAALGHTVFADGAMTTGFLEAHQDELVHTGEPDKAMLNDAARAISRYWNSGSLEKLAGFRLNRPVRRMVTFDVEGVEYEADANLPPTPGSHVISLRERGVLVTRHGRTMAALLKRGESAGGAAASNGAILAPMPGNIVSVLVAQGDRVSEGQKLLTLEAMKMEHTLVAPFDGIVAELEARQGAQVQVETMLARIELEEQ